MSKIQALNMVEEGEFQTCDTSLLNGMDAFASRRWSGRSPSQISSFSSKAICELMLFNMAQLSLTFENVGDAM